MARNNVLHITFQIFSADFEFFEKEDCSASCSVIVRNALITILLETTFVYESAEF